MESSSSVRVIEVKGAIVSDAGMGASGEKRQIAKVNGRRRNFRCMKVVSRASKPRRASLGIDGSETRPHTVSDSAYGFLDCGLGQQTG